MKNNEKQFVTFFCEPNRYQMHRYKQALDMFFQAEKLMQRVDHEVYYYIGKC